MDITRLTTWDEELGSYLHTDPFFANNLDHWDYVNYIGFLEEIVLKDEENQEKIIEYLKDLKSVIEIVNSEKSGNDEKLKY